jgi:hypothetical protein
MAVNNDDFTVDLAERAVRHKSGVVVRFYEYETPEVWLIADSVIIDNPDLFDGNIDQLAVGAKRAALAAGMEHRKP